MNTQSPMPTVDPLLEFRLSQAENHIAKQDEVISKLEELIRQNRIDYDAKLQEIKDHSDAQERSRMLWGISTLGSIVMTMGVVLWNYRAIIFKGNP